ncbi:cupin domain-containing protein [Chengkuizengella sediminis]|uniref:cupin domain-containing protein n=1 Tax=Chengkuizengella sediminis TaxID=1885917 RepID=UPI001389BB3E|nr:cupin domain-containing protein [Chengkuizengella sediminis]NDI35953.1 cupin domain-containing protein [Chengkuizengella sediminis]
MKQDHIVIKKEDRDWIEGMFHNSEYQMLYSETDEEKETQAFIVRFGPGGFIPYHDHPGREYAYVIEGTMKVGDDILGPGDFLTAGKNEKHIVETQDGVTFLTIIEKPIDIVEDVTEDGTF